MDIKFSLNCGVSEFLLGLNHLNICSSHFSHSCRLAYIDMRSSEICQHEFRKRLLFFFPFQGDLLEFKLVYYHFELTIPTASAADYGSLWITERLLNDCILRTPCSFLQLKKTSYGRSLFIETSISQILR